MNWASNQLALHGAIVLLCGLVSGVPYGRAIVSGREEDILRGWRVAHAGLAMGGTTMIAVAALLSRGSLGPSVEWAVSLPFVVSGYGFVAALPLGAAFGHRGLSPTGSVVNRVVYLGNVVGAVGSLIGTVALAFGLARQGLHLD